MTEIYGELKPTLDDDLLMHYGVLGMKWGKRRAKASGTEIIAARHRVHNEHGKVKRAEKKAASIDDPDARKVALNNASKMKTAYLKNPDRVIASRLTRGEKAAAFALTFYTGGLAGAAAVAGTSARSRRIERKQERAKYDDPKQRKAVRKAMREQNRAAGQ